METKPRIFLKLLEMEDASELLRIRLESRQSLSPYEPFREEAFWSLEGQIAHIVSGLEGVERGTGYPMGIRDAASGTLIGRIELSGIARGPFQNANLGYFMDYKRSGTGVMTEAVTLCKEIAFRELGLHRIQAAVMPVNKASAAVLEKNGFRREGLALRYLHINGKWEDHLLYAATNDESSE